MKVRFLRNGREIHATCRPATLHVMEKKDYQRWIPIVVPVSALALLIGIYFIAAEVLARTG